MLQVGSSSYEIQTFTVGRMQIMIYAKEIWRVFCVKIQNLVSDCTISSVFWLDGHPTYLGFKNTKYFASY